MKRALASAALLALFASPASALELWQGDLFVTAISETAANDCKDVNVIVGDFGRSVYRRKGLPGAGASDLLTWVRNRSAIQLVPTAPAGGSLHGATAGTVRTIFGSAGFSQVAGVTFSGTTVSPPAPVAATPNVTILMTIKDVYSPSAASPSGCTMTLKGTLAKRPA